MYYYVRFAMGNVHAGDDFQQDLASLSIPPDADVVTLTDHYNKSLTCILDHHLLHEKIPSPSALLSHGFLMNYTGPNVINENWNEGGDEHNSLYIRRSFENLGMPIIIC